MALDIFVDHKNKTFYWDGTPTTADFDGEFGFYTKLGYDSVQGKAPESVVKRVNKQKAAKVESEQNKMNRDEAARLFTEKLPEIEANLTASEREYYDNLKGANGKVNSQIRRSYLKMIEEKNKLANEDDKKKYDDAYRAEKEKQAQAKLINATYEGSVIGNARKAVDYDKMPKA